MERSVLSVNIQIVARSEDVTTFERGYAGEKVEKLQRYFDHIHSIEVILERDHERAMAEVILAAGKNQTLWARRCRATSCRPSTSLWTN